MDLQAIWRQFLGREAHPVIQFVKYGISGGLAVVTHITCFYLISWLILPALQPDDPVVRLLGLSTGDMPDTVRASHACWNNWIAFVPSNLVAYIINRIWVFTPGRHHWVLEIALFYAVSAISIGIGTEFMRRLILWWQFSTTVAFGANIVTAALVNYAMRKFVIFKG